MRLNPARALCLLVPLLVVACATQDDGPKTVGLKTPPPAEPAGKPVPVPKDKSALSREAQMLLAKRNLAPITGEPLTAKTDCKFRDEDGYRGRLQMTVNSSAIEQLEARVDVPRRGSCQFRFTNFRQIESRPVPVLESRQSACKISLYEQGEKVAVAFRNCRKECEGNAVDYLWPILVDTRDGTCS